MTQECSQSTIDHPWKPIQASVIRLLSTQRCRVVVCVCVCLDCFGVAMRSGQAGEPQTDACLMLKVLKQGRPNFCFPYNVGPTTITWVFKKCKSCICWSVRMFYLLKDFFFPNYIWYNVMDSAVTVTVQIWFRCCDLHTTTLLETQTELHNFYRTYFFTHTRACVYINKQTRTHAHTLLLLFPGAELSLIAESFGLLNDLLLPFLSILDASCPIFDFHLASVLFDVILPSVLGSPLWSFGEGFPIKYLLNCSGIWHSLHVTKPA